MGLSFVEGGGKPKIYDLDLPLLAYDNIVGFDVSVGNSILMEIGYCLCDLNGYLFLLLFWQNVSILPDILLQGLSSHHELKEQMDLRYG